MTKKTPRQVHEKKIAVFKIKTGKFMTKNIKRGKLKKKKLNSLDRKT